MRIITIVYLIINSIFMSQAYALESDYKESITVDSEQQMADLKNNKATFINDVHITQGTIKINADKVEIFRTSQGELKQIIGYGKPVTFFQILDNNKPINAKGEKLVYDPITHSLDLSVNAEIQQENSKINSDRITYNIEKEILEATRDTKKQNNRVKTVFIPNELKTQVNESKK
ncbi:MAG: lipopolysaccharide transport periplasmic protein LptA [Succinivibrionaceae bacterium]